MDINEDYNPKENPFRNVRKSIIDFILDAEGLPLEGRHEDRIRRLYFYYKDDINVTGETELSDYPLHMLYVYAIFHGIPLDDEHMDFDNEEMEDYIKISYILNSENPDDLDLLNDALYYSSNRVKSYFAKKFNIPKEYFLLLPEPSSDQEGLYDSLKQAIHEKNMDIFINHPTIKPLVEKYRKLYPYREYLLRLYNENEEFNFETSEDVLIYLSQVDEDIPIDFLASLEAKFKLDVNTPYSEEVIKTMGILIPYMYKDSPEQYYKENIEEYYKMFLLYTNKKYFKELPSRSSIISSRFWLFNEEINSLRDIDIFTIFTVRLIYRSRKELVKNIIHAHHNRTFMVPYDPLFVEISNNKNTMEGKPLSEVDSFLVCYGTLSNFVTYDIKELLQTFLTSTPQNMFPMPKKFIRGKRRNFTLEEIIALWNIIYEAILDKNKHSDLLLRLINTIELLLIEKYRMDEYKRIILLTDQGEFRKIEEERKKNIKIYLYTVGVIALYSRGWLGPEDPLPLSRSDVFNKKNLSKGTKSKLGKQIRMKINQLKELTEELQKKDKEIYNKIRNFFAFDFIEGIGVFYPKEIKLHQLLEELEDKKVSSFLKYSKLLISTVCYHLLLFFNEGFPELSLKKLQDLV